MNKEFALYEESLALKELGFDEPCFGLFIRDKSLLVKEMPNQNECELYFGGILAPTFSQAFRWFREKHKLNGLLHHYPNTKLWGCSVHNLEWSVKELLNYLQTEDRSVKYSIYEEAELACLRKLIQIVKEKES